MSKITVILDSSQVASFDTCPSLWYYKYKRRLALTGLETNKNEAMLMGTYGHSMLEEYYKARALGVSGKDAIEIADNFNIDAITCKCGCTKAYHRGEGTKCERCKECEAFIPEPFPLVMPKRAEVKNRVHDYFYVHSNIDVIPNSVDSVEVGFSIPIFEDEFRLYILEGRIDLLGIYKGLKVFMDHKFQTRRHDLYKKAIQFRNYSLATGCDIGIINYIRLAKNIDRDTFKRDIITFSEAEKEMWKKQLLAIFDDVAMCIMNSKNHLHVDSVQISEERQFWHQRDQKRPSQCDGKFGYPCDFTQLCEEPNISLLPFKENLYTIKPEWRPW